MGIRKNFLYLTSDERDQFFEALLKMKAHMVNPMAPAADQYSVYDQLASRHWAVFKNVRASEAPRAPGCYPRSP